MYLRREKKKLAAGACILLSRSASGIFIYFGRRGPHGFWPGNQRTSATGEEASRKPRPLGRLYALTGLATTSHVTCG